jgi:glycerol uptake facilitator-like aquaporin
MLTTDPFLVGILFYIVIFGARLMSFKSGSVFNPAQALALELFQAIIDGSWYRFQTCYIYVLGPFSGGLVMTYFFKYFAKPYMIRVKQI